MSIPVELFVSPLPEVVDAAIEAYVSWREECADVRDTYRRWSCAPKADRMLASSAYIAALDREEIAAIVYAEAMRRLSAECADTPLPERRRESGAQPSSRPGR